MTENLQRKRTITDVKKNQPNQKGANQKTTATEKKGTAKVKPGQKENKAPAKN